MLDYADVIPDWTEDLSVPASFVWTPSPAGDTAAPGDSLAQNIWAGLQSIGEKTIDFASKTSDLFANTLGNIAQAKNAWEVIVDPENAKPLNPQANSQLPSLQPAGSTSGQLANWLNLVGALYQVYRGKQSNNITATTVSNAGKTILIIAVIGVAIFLLMRPKHA